MASNKLLFQSFVKEAPLEFRTMNQTADAAKENSVNALRWHRCALRTSCETGEFSDLLKHTLAFTGFGKMSELIHFDGSLGEVLIDGPLGRNGNGPRNPSIHR